VVVEHLARVEGHGGITVELDGNEVSAVHFQIREGLRLLEGLVRGRSYEDVSQIVSRICAICSAAHSLTSLKATEQAFGVTPTEQTDVLRDLMFRGENIESHALHLFLLALPDYLGYPSAVAMAADHPDAVRLGLRLKKLGNSIQETVGGRAVHPVNAVLGGFAKLPTTDQLIALRKDLRQGMADRELAIDLMSSLAATDYCESDTTYAALRQSGAHGYYRGDSVVFASGEIEETANADSYNSVTAEQTVPHSHAKHSLYKGMPFMVGALARLAVNGVASASNGSQMLTRLGLGAPFRSPMDNNKAQAVELMLDIEHALNTVEQLLDRGIEPEAPVPVQPRAGRGTAVTEAPRGLLVHTYDYDAEGVVKHANIVTPTAVNAASIEDHIRRTVEQNNHDETAVLTKKLEMIVRAYDPCISCSVHLISKRHAD